MVHRLPLEKGLPEIHRLSVSLLLGCPQAPPPCCQRSCGGGGLLHLACVWFSSALKSQLSIQLLQLRLHPLPLSSTEPFQLWKEPKDSGVASHIAVWDSSLLPHHSHSSQVWGKPRVQLNSVKNNKHLEVSPVFMLGSVLHLSMFCKALVFKWKVLSKKWVHNKGQKLFLCVFVKREKNFFLSERRVGTSLLTNIVKRRGGEVFYFLFFLSLSLLLFFLFISLFCFWTFFGRPIFYRRLHNLSSVLTASRECTAEPVEKKKAERKAGRETHKMNDQCKKRKNAKKKDTIYSQG